MKTVLTHLKNEIFVNTLDLTDWKLHFDFTLENTVKSVGTFSRKRADLEFGSKYICAWQNSSCMCFMFLCQHSHMFGRECMKMFRVVKVHRPFPTEHNLPVASYSGLKT